MLNFILYVFYHNFFLIEKTKKTKTKIRVTISKAIHVLAPPLPLTHSTPAPVAFFKFSKHVKHIPASGPLYCLLPLPGMPFPQISAWLSFPSCLRSHVFLSVRSFLITPQKKHPLTFSVAFTVFIAFTSSWHILKVFVYKMASEVTRAPSVMEWLVCKATYAFHDFIPSQPHSRQSACTLDHHFCMTQ